VDVEISITATMASMRLVAADTGINSRFRQLSLSESIQIKMSKKYTDSVRGLAHAVIIRPNADGSADYYNPQTGWSGTLPKGTYSDWKY